MKKAVVDGWQGASFKGVDFSRWVTSWRDTRATNYAMHVYLKREGGEAEDMGRAPHEAQVTLSYLGKNWRSEYLKLQAAIDDGPIGDLLHPVHGTMRAVCAGPADAGMDLENGVNHYTVPLRFIESAVDTKTKANDNTGPEAQAQDLDAKADTVTTSTAQYTTAATTVATLLSLAATFKDAALASASATGRDPSLSQQVESIRVQAQLAAAAVRADPAASTDASRFPALIAIEQLYDSCALLDDALRQQKPRVFVYRVPGRIHVAKLAQVFYGPDGIDRIDEILANNANRIADPGMISAGVDLLMAVPTV